MFRRSINSLLCAVLLIAMLPLAILSSLFARFKFRHQTKARRGSPLSESAVPKRRIGEFDFHGALTAYEDLIDELIEDSAA